MLSGVLTVSLSTVALALPGPTAVAVKVAVDWPLVVEDAGGAIVPPVDANDTGIPSGTKPPPDVSALFESCVRSCVMVEVWVSGTVAADAPMRSKSHGSASTPAEAESHPVFPGPALHPHQFFSNVAVNGPLPTVVAPAAFPTIRL